MLATAVYRRLFHCNSSNYQKIISRMAVYPDAYFRHKEGCDTFNYCFFLEKEDLKVSRNFNFSRKVTENIGEFQNRILTNVEKTLSKKRKKKSKDDASDAGDGIKVVFTADGKEVDSSKNCKEVLSSFNVTMNVLGIDFKVLVNRPVVTAIALPDSMLADFPISPSKLDVDFGERKNCLFTWFLSCNELANDTVNKETLVYKEVAQGASFTPSSDDVNHVVKLKCQPLNGQQEGPPIEVFSKNKIEASPGHCPFDTRHKFTTEFLNGNRLRILSYNILADIYTDSDYSREVLFPYCPPYALAIDYRKQLFMKEIAGYKADLICLQEVDKKVFNFDLEPFLSELGYSGLFDKKGGKVDEGVACFFRNDTFVLEDQACITVSSEVQSNPLFQNILDALSKNEALKKRMLDRGTILQMLVLRHRSTGHLFVVGTTHLYFHPDADHVRLLQAATGLSYLQQKYKEINETNGKCSLIFCGDFNSTPEFGVYKLMTEGHIPKDYADWKSNESEAVVDLGLEHTMKFASACGCPKYTNFTVGFADCLDYIFYQTDHLTVTQVVPLPSDEELQQYSAIPSVVQPSDHVALVADFEITL